MPASTVEDLLTLAIQIEKLCERMYRRMEGMFPSEPQVAAFWRNYADEEAGHARWLEKLQTKSTPEQLTQKADATVLSAAERMLEFATTHALKTVNNMEDAYQLATELENSETNVIFEFLIENYADDPATVTFLRLQLQGHMANLEKKIPAQFQSKSARQGLKAQAG